LTSAVPSKTHRANATAWTCGEVCVSDDVRKRGETRGRIDRSPIGEFNGGDLVADRWDSVPGAKLVDRNEICI